MSKKILQLLSLVLSLALLIQLLPVSALALELEEQDQSTLVGEVTENIDTEAPEIFQEDISRRGEYSKEFVMDGGLRMAVVYGEPVHYQHEGQWEEIDNTLKSVGTTYTNTAGPWQVSFPRQLSKSNAVSITKDGYTLSFYMAGELRGSGDLQVMSIATPDEAQDTTAQPLQTATAQVKSIDWTEEKAKLEHPETLPEKLRSSLSYSGVYTNTDIVYDLHSNQVKESVVMSAYSAGLQGYRYTLNVGQLNPVLTDSGEIHLYDRSKKELVMVMPAPFLVDKAGETSYDVSVSLTGSGSTYTLTYRLPQQWLADSSRQWPVVLDPVVEADTTRTNIRDVTVYENNATSNNNDSKLYIGHGGSNGDINSYLKYAQLPVLTTSDVIVAAQLTLYKINTSSGQVNVHGVLGTWESETLTYDNVPGVEYFIEDYAVVNNPGYYAFEVTDIVRGWYDSENTGLMLTGPNTGTYQHSFASADSSTYPVPSLSIVFRNYNGLESYWDYTTISAGRAGTGYINCFSGNLVWVHSGIGFGGNLMPVSINCIYNGNDGSVNAYGMGNGWQTNYHQTVKEYTENQTNTTYYVWNDSDGTDHYFYLKEGNVYQDEDGLELELTKSTTDPIYTIEDKKGNVSYFDSNGRLYEIRNNQISTSKISIAYVTGFSPLIYQIKDGANRVYRFTYQNGLLSSIIYYGTGSTSIATLSFTHSGDDLTKIYDQDGNYSLYNYVLNCMLSAKSYAEEPWIVFGYNSMTAGVPHRVSTVIERSGANSITHLTIDYDQNQTTFTDVNGNQKIMLFNNWGNTTSVQDGEGRAQFAGYASNDPSDGQKVNQLLLSSKLQNTVGNILQNISFESSNLWGTINGVSSGITTDKHYLGEHALKLQMIYEAPVAGAASPAFTAQAGETYTFSAYVRTEDAANAWLSLGPDSTVVSETLPANQDWTRLQVTYTNSGTSDVTACARILTSAYGVVYADCVQLEKAETASRYNLVENGDFRYEDYGWNESTYCQQWGQRVQNPTCAAAQLDQWVYLISGMPEQKVSLYQTVKVSGLKDDTLVLAGWANGNSVPLTGNRRFAIRGTFQYTDGTTSSDKFTFSFNPDANRINSWKYTSGAMVAEKAYSSVLIEILYDYNANNVLFDGIQLYKEEFGNSYTYDEHGNVKKVVDIQKQETEYEYDNQTNSKLTQIIQNGKAKVTYTYYPDSYNVKTATTQEGVVYSFTYDDYGNNTSVSIQNGESLITSTATYTSDGNRLEETTDARGNTTTYSYNANTNLLEWVQYPKDTEATRTEYTYDSMYRISQTELATDTDLSLSAAYTYNNDLLTSIQTASTTYSFTYGDFAQRSSVKIGNRTLAEYSYENSTNRLKQLDYGNGNHVKYTYDNQGRVTKQEYNDGAYVTYKYDNSGALATVYDSQTGITTTYYYDFTDRMMKYVEKGGNVSHTVGYTYDSLNNLTALVETINGTKRTTAYSYDDDNRITQVASGSTAESYSYDGYGRLSETLTKHSGQTVVPQSITYVGDSTGEPTTMPFQLIYSGNSYATTLGYIYDVNGNISYVNQDASTTIYRYDSANQLIRENFSAAGTTTLWTYDDAGNILKREVYPYTGGTPNPATKISETVYAYTDSQWGDLLTAYNGVPITYDTIGNPLNDGTWSYTWQHGRQLASMSRLDQSVAWQFGYNAEGMRLYRTNGTSDYRYAYLGTQLTRMTVAGNTLDFTYDAAGTPIALTYNGTTYYYVTNLQGDIISILNTSGTEVVRYLYDAWGNLISMTGTLASTVGFYNPLRYRGYVYDTETGLYYVSSRYYDPEIGRWINADSVIAGVGGSIQGYNMFAYCFNNPVNMSDSSGHWPQWMKDAANWVNNNIIQPVANFFSPSTNTISGQFQEGILRGSGSLTGGYSEINGRLQVNSKDSKNNGMLGGFAKVSTGNASGKIGVGNDNVALSVKGVGDGLTATAQAGVQYKNGAGLAAKAKAAVLSGRATAELELFGWQIEFGVSGDLLSAGAEAMIGVFPDEGFTAKASVGAGLFGGGFVFRVKPAQ